MRDLPTDKYLTSLIALQHIDGLGPTKLGKMIERAGSIQQFFSAGEELLPTRDGGKPWCRQLRQFFRQPLHSMYWEQAERTLDWLEANACEAIAISDERFPPLLRELPDSPLVIYACGNIKLLQQSPLAIVGARKLTRTGQDAATEFAAGLAQNGVTIISGMALGVDTAAHEGALSVGGGTVAVWATGLDTVYPLQNKDLAQRIARQGCILTEMPLQTPALPGYFPRRNRIVSGLSLGVLVIEAALKSGSLITAKFALEQNREVFAVPGSIYSPLSSGCHQLIKQGAKLVESAADVLEEISMSTMLACGVTLAPPAGGKALPDDADAQQVLQAIGFEPTSYEQIAAYVELEPARISALLSELQLSRHICIEMGMYQRVVT